MNKKYMMFGLLSLFAVAIVSAGYLVNSLSLTVGIEEPFEVRYAVLGDAGTWDGITTCESLEEDDSRWFMSDSTSLPTGNMLIGESRGVCVEITNEAEAKVTYTISADVTNDNEDNDCANAFGLPELMTGEVDANDGNTDGKLVTGVGIIIADDATPVEGCNIVIDVYRGTLD